MAVATAGLGTSNLQLEADRKRRRKKGEGGIPDAPKKTSPGPRGGQAQPGRGGPVSAPPPETGTPNVGTGPSTPPVGPLQETDAQRALRIAGDARGAQRRANTPQERADFALMQANQLVQEQQAKLAAAQALEGQDLRQNFGGQLDFSIAQEAETARQRARMAAGASGLSGSGVAQAAQNAISGNVATARVTSMAQFEGRLLQAQQSERELFRRGAFDFITSLSKMHNSGQIERGLIRLRADIAASAEKTGRWNAIMGTIGGIVGLGIGSFLGPVGAAAGAAIGKKLGGGAEEVIT